MILGNPITLGGKKKGRLPEWLQEVEYLESTGSQRINSGIYGSSNLTVDITFSITQVAGQQLFGSSWPRCSLGVTNANVYTFGAGTLYANQGDVLVGSKYNALVEFGETSTLFSYDQIVSTLSPGTFSNDRPIYIFARNNEGTADGFSYARIYSISIYDRSADLRYIYVPCYNTETGIGGFFELLMGTFLVSSGANLVIGPDVLAA